MALRAPKQLPETKRARTKAPTGPNTWLPKATATVLEDSITWVGRTRK